MRKLTFVLGVICMAALITHCGSSDQNIKSGSTTSLNDAEGAALATDSALSYVFSTPIRVGSVNASTFFINPITTTQASMIKSGNKVASNAGLCDLNAAIDAAVMCLSNTICILDPLENLSDNANFIACLTSGILTESGINHPGASILFSTGSGGDDDGDGDDNGGAQLLVLGETCTVDADCESGFCTDGACCDTACDQPCEECSSGTCAAIAEADDNPECSGSETCDANGDCMIKQGEACEAAEDCITGFCKDGVCCDTECTEECFACNYEGTEGTCTATPNGESDDPECAAPAECWDGRPAIQSKFIADLPMGRCRQVEN